MVRIHKHEYKVTSLQRSQYPYKLDRDAAELKRTSRNEHSNLVAHIANNKILCHNDGVIVRIQLFHFLSYYVGKTCDYCIFEEVYTKQINYQVDGSWKETSDSCEV